MSELVPLQGGMFRRESRAVGREVSRLNALTRVEVARLDQQADVQAGRLQAIAYVGRQVRKLKSFNASPDLHLGLTRPPRRVSYWLRPGLFIVGKKKSALAEARARL